MLQHDAKSVCQCHEFRNLVAMLLTLHLRSSVNYLWWRYCRCCCCVCGPKLEMFGSETAACPHICAVERLSVFNLWTVGFKDSVVNIYHSVT